MKKIQTLIIVSLMTIGSLWSNPEQKDVYKDSKTKIISNLTKELNDLVALLNIPKETLTPSDYTKIKSLTNFITQSNIIPTLATVESVQDLVKDEPLPVFVKGFSIKESPSVDISKVKFSEKDIETLLQKKEKKKTDPSRVPLTIKQIKKQYPVIKAPKKTPLQLDTTPEKSRIKKYIKTAKKFKEDNDAIIKAGREAIRKNGIKLVARAYRILSGMALHL